MSNDLFNKYNQIKFQLLNYTKNLKDIQAFNQAFQKMIQEKFNFIKKKVLSTQNYNMQGISSYSRESLLNSRFFTLNFDGLNNTTLLNQGEDKSNLNLNYSLNKDINKNKKLFDEEEKNKIAENNNRK